VDTFWAVKLNKKQTIKVSTNMGFGPYWWILLPVRFLSIFTTKKVSTNTALKIEKTQKMCVFPIGSAPLWAGPGRQGQAQARPSGSEMTYHPCPKCLMPGMAPS
jgi:hypothetical protein